jgi:DNA-binding MarR family transcriptional regulator
MEVTWPETGLELLDLSLLCRKADRMVAEGAGMSVDEMHCLTLVSVKNPLSVKRLRESLGLSPTRISKILRSLEENGYIRRELSTSDRRVEHVSLTQKGNEMVEELLAISTNIGQQVFQNYISARPPVRQSGYVDASD